MASPKSASSARAMAVAPLEVVATLLLMAKILLQLSLAVYSNFIIHMVLYIPGAGFLPPTVVHL